MDPPKITLVSLAAVAERSQSLQRTALSWRAKVQCSGRRRLTDGVLAYVRTPGGPTSPAQPLFRLTGPPRLLSPPKLTQSNRRGTDPYARWWGGVAPRGVPLSRSSTLLGHSASHSERLFLPHSGHLFAVNPYVGRVAFGDSAVNAGAVTTAHMFSSSASDCEALSFMQSNSPACRRSRLSSPLQIGEIQENLSLYMRTFGKYLAISGNIECYFPLSDRRLRRANRRTT